MLNLVALQIKKLNLRFMWCTPVIPAFGKLRQEDCEFQASLCNVARPYQKKKKDKKEERREGRKKGKKEGTKEGNSM
jgi:hypothetical protein